MGKLNSANVHSLCAGTSPCVIQAYVTSRHASGLDILQNHAESIRYVISTCGWGDVRVSVPD